jgi:hypothetical protein
MPNTDNVVRISQLPPTNMVTPADLFETVQGGISKKIAAAVLLAGGASGYSGISGYSGAIGISGFSGMNGLFAGSGYSGFSGFSGFSGYSGIGLSGFSGYSGISGVSGFSGSSGIGINGISGFSGFSGTNGSASGYSGYSGYSGTNGANGISGYSGVGGSNGISGFSGYSGLGFSGFSGYSGANGNNGSQGVSGFSGFSGVSGFSGFSGISGYSGYSGISGFSGSGSSITITTNDIAYATSTNTIGGSALFTYNNISQASGFITIANTPQATNLGTGALVISGGLSVAGSEFIGGNLTVSNNVFITSDTINIGTPNSGPGSISLQAPGSAVIYINATILNDAEVAYNVNNFSRFAHYCSSTQFVFNDSANNYNTLVYTNGTSAAGFWVFPNTTPTNNLGTGAVLISGGVVIVGNLAYGAVNPVNAGNSLTWNAQGVLIDSGYSASSAGGSGGSVKMAQLNYNVASGTGGGTSTAGAYETRPLNTIVSDPNNIIISLTSNQFTLAPGTYRIDATIPFYCAGVGRGAVYNVTDSAFALYGANIFTTTSAGLDVPNGPISGIIAVSGSNKTFAIQSRCGNGLATYGWGSPVSFTENEIYAVVNIAKIG